MPPHRPHLFLIILAALAKRPDGIEQPAFDDDEDSSGHTQHPAEQQVEVLALDRGGMVHEWVEDTNQDTQDHSDGRDDDQDPQVGSPIITRRLRTPGWLGNSRLECAHQYSSASKRMEERKSDK